MREFRSSRLVFVGIVVLLLLGLLLPACGESATPTAAKGAEPTRAPAAATTVPVATTAPAASPTAAAKKGGVAIILQTVDSTNGTFDPHAGGLSGWALGYDLIYENLFSRDPKTFELVPQIAEKYEVAPDASSITITLRKGVKWHNVPPVNGREFTTDDIKWNIERQQNANPAFATTTYWKRVKTIEVTDKYTFKLIFTAPYASITWLISDPNIMWYPHELQETYGDKQMKAAIGTGPFMLKSYEPKVSIEYVKNPDYYMKGYPLLDGYKQVFISDATAALSAIRSGQIHLLSGQSLASKDSLVASVKGLQSNPHIGNPYVAWMNCTIKPFDDIRVRQAVHLAIDRQELIQLVEQGSGSLMTNYSGAQVEVFRKAAELANVPGYRQPKDQDIAEAKRLLAEAGYANGLTVEVMVVPGVGNTMRANEVIHEQLLKVGIDWKIKSVDMNTIYAAVFNKPPTVQVYTPGVTTRPDLDKSNYYSTKSAANLWGFGSAELDELWAKGLSEGDDAKRAAIYKQADDVLLSLANTPPLYQSDAFWVASPEVRDWKFYPGASAYWQGQMAKYMWLDK